MSTMRRSLARRGVRSLSSTAAVQQREQVVSLLSGWSIETTPAAAKKVADVLEFLEFEERGTKRLVVTTSLR